MEKETLEEFIKKQLALGKYQDQESAIKHSIELGAKWQQEQDKKLYSEEDLRSAYNAESEGWVGFDLWFKQFKNK
jgi:Arc/MetJ-type ribon-helix-helix transcriptional regulator